MSSDYWDTFYESAALSKNLRDVPSQFAAFFAGEIGEKHQIIDIGCGTGRDTFFFDQIGHDVVGIDSSRTVIAANVRRAEELQRSVRFMHGVVGSSELEGTLSRSRRNSATLALYARFFLHAVEEDLERKFFTLASSLCVRGDLVALEFRTEHDRTLPKATAAHYRRYVNPADVIARAQSCGFAVSYSVEGFGFAKYREDDAYVARLVLRR